MIIMNILFKISHTVNLHYDCHCYFIHLITTFLFNFYSRYMGAVLSLPEDERRHDFVSKSIYDYYIEGKIKFLFLVWAAQTVVSYCDAWSHPTMFLFPLCHYIWEPRHRDIQIRLWSTSGR